LKLSLNTFEELILFGLHEEKNLGLSLSELQHLECLKRNKQEALDVANSLLEQRESCPVELFHFLKVLDQLPLEYVSERLEEEGFKKIKGLKFVSQTEAAFHFEI